MAGPGPQGAAADGHGWHSTEPGLFEEVVVTNSIPLAKQRRFPQLRVLSVANMLGEAIWRIHEESSVSSMFR